MSQVIDEHRFYLADKPRLNAYQQAISALIKDGDVVLDLGCGSGILGLFACRAGAARVYAIEMGGMVELARKFAKVNGYADRIIHIKDFSMRVQLPEKVDAIICDQVGRFGFEAGIQEYFADARRRFLKPNGVMIPNAIHFFSAPIEQQQVFDQIDFWRHPRQGFDFSPAHLMASNTGYPTRFKPEELLANPAPLGSVDLMTGESSPFTVAGQTKVTRNGIIHGIGGWFEASLAPGISMSNGPLSAAAIDRRNVFFPIAEPLSVSVGDSVHMWFHLDPGEVMASWRVEVSFCNGAPTRRFQHSTFLGMFLPKEDVVRTRPDFKPTLTPWGVARGAILELCDGSRELADIEKVIWERYKELFRGPGEAARFVAEVVTRYSQ